MPAVSIYLKNETLQALDSLVQAQASLDKASGLKGRQVASRSSIVESLILEKSSSPSLSMQEITYAIIELAEQYGAEKVSVFGSFARGDATESSDVDILLEKGKIKGLKVLDFQDALAERLGRQVDVVTTAGASPRFLNRIQPDCIEVYRAPGKGA